MARFRPQCEWKWRDFMKYPIVENQMKAPNGLIVMEYWDLILKALKYSNMNQETKCCFFQFEIIINVIVSSVSFIITYFTLSALANLTFNVDARAETVTCNLKVIYHPLCSMNTFVTNKSRWGTIVSLNSYHVTLEGHMIANHTHIWGDRLSCDPLRGSHNSQSPHIRT